MSDSLEDARGFQLSTRTALAKFSVLLAILSVSLLIGGFSANAQTVVDGGLTAPETGWSLGPNLLVNGDFSQGTSGWTFSGTCFSVDPATVAPNGAASLEMSPAACGNLAPIAINSLKVSGGAVYTLSGQLKTEDFMSSNRYAGHLSWPALPTGPQRLCNICRYPRATLRPCASRPTNRYRPGTHGLQTCRCNGKHRRACRCSCCTRTTAD
jgi:hypothetical protein